MYLWPGRAFFDECTIAKGRDASSRINAAQRRPNSGAALKCSKPENFGGASQERLR